MNRRRNRKLHVFTTQVRMGLRNIDHPQDVAVDPKGNIVVLDGAGTKQASVLL